MKEANLRLGSGGAFGMPVGVDPGANDVKRGVGVSVLMPDVILPNGGAFVAAGIVPVAGVVVGEGAFCRRAMYARWRIFRFTRPGPSTACASTTVEDKQMANVES